MAPPTIPALSGALAIALGAFGAHALKGRVDEKMADVWATASHYHLVHAAASIAAYALDKAALNAKVQHHSSGPLAIKLFTAGTALFSGSLYLMVLTGERRLGMVTPIGGITLILGWLVLAF